MTKIKTFFKYDRVFLLILFIVGLLATFSYGVYFDQSSEQTILFSNLKEYLLQLGAGDSQLVKEMDAVGIIEISQSIEKDHGIAAYYPAGIVWFINQSSGYAGSIFWHVYTFLLVFLGVVSLYFLSKALFQSTKVASFTTLLFFLSPRMFAESHYNNKDMVLVSFVFMLFYLGWRVSQEASWKHIILFAVAGAFAFNVKIIGAWFFGLIGLYALLCFICTKRFHKGILLKVCTCILLWLVTFVLITPATWSGLIEYIQYVLGFTLDFARWNAYILYNGQLIHNEITGIPHKYLPTLIVYTTPILILVLLAVGGCFLLYHLWKKRFRNLWQREGYLCLIAMAGFLPLCFAVLASTSVYNGWRHFYFVYCSIILCAGYGVYRLNQLVSKKLRSSLRISLGAVYVGILSITLLLNHPFQNCYYNLLAGKDVQNRYEMDYWNLSMWQAMNFVAKDTPEGNITVSAYNAATSVGMEENQKAMPKKDASRITIIENWLEADYIIVNMTYSNMYNVGDYATLQKDYELVKAFKSYGNTVAEVYRAK